MTTEKETVLKINFILSPSMKASCQRMNFSVDHRVYIYIYIYVCVCVCVCVCACVCVCVRARACEHLCTINMLVPKLCARRNPVMRH